jgi:hypothetical protein
VIRLFGWALSIVGAVCVAGLALAGASTLGAWVVVAAGAIVALAPEVES